MSQHSIYTSPRWLAARERALARDGERCTVSRLLGGRCGGTLHVHHIVPLADGGAPFDLDNLGTSCARHHPRWEALRRAVLGGRERARRRCPHRHTSREARRQCEARLNRQLSSAA